MTKIRKFWISREEFYGVRAGDQAPQVIGFKNVGGLTAGSIPFANATGFLAEDNAALFWDIAQDFLGIGVSAPVCRTHIRVAECADYDDVLPDVALLLENDANVRLQLQAATTSTAYIEFCSDENNPPAGRVAYDFPNDQLEFGVGGNEILRLQAGPIFDYAGTLTFSGIISVAGASINLEGNAELRFYDNGNYVGFVAPALDADRIWALPDADAPAANQCLMSDGAGSLGWSQALGTTDSPTFDDLTLGAAPLIRQASGALTFQTNEGVNTDTIVALKGKGTGHSIFQLYDQDDAEYFDFRIFNGAATIQVLGANPGVLQLQYGTAQNITFWGGIAAGNPYFEIWGHGTAANEYLRMRVEADNDALIEAEHNLNLRAGGGEINLGDENLSTSGAIEVGTQAAAISGIYTSGSRPARFCQFVNANSYQSVNLYFAGDNWNLDDVSANGAVISLSTSSFKVRYAPLGVNPRALVELLHLDYDGGNLGVGQLAFGANATKTLALGTGVAPTTDPIDCFQMYSADIGGAAGKAGAHFRDEEGNIVSIGSGGMLSTGTARVVNALWIDAQSIKAPQTNPALLISHGTLETPAYQFADAIEANQESVTFNMRIPNRMDRSVAPTISVGWSADGINPGNCRWQLEYLYTAPGEDTGAAAQATVAITGTAAAVANGMVLSTFPALALPDATDICIHCRVTRLSADVLDTIADTTELHGVCLSWTSNKLGLAT